MKRLKWTPKCIIDCILIRGKKCARSAESARAKLADEVNLQFARIESDGYIVKNYDCIDKNNTNRGFGKGKKRSEFEKKGCRDVKTPL